MTFWFANILVHRPYIILIIVAVFSGSCLIIPFALKTFPNFSDPEMGFETRGTSLSKRVITWKNLVEATRPSGIFSVNPKEIIIKKNVTDRLTPKKKKGKKKKKVKQEPTIGTTKLFVATKHGNHHIDNIAALQKYLQSNLTLKDIRRLSHEGFFCGPPDDSYAQVVVKAKEGHDLFSMDSLMVMCRIEHEFMQAKLYKDLCITPPKHEKCCKVWSLGNYIALLQNRTSCLAITEDDISATKKLLRHCAHYFNNLSLFPDCSYHGHCSVPHECTRQDGVYNILNYITSTSFLSDHKSGGSMVLKEAMIFLPLACSSAMLPYYHNVQGLKLDFEELSVVALEFGIKNVLFDECLIKDVWLLGAGSIFVVMCMWMYTASAFLTAMTLTAIIFSLGISYFIYTLVFDLEFFPFMNLLAVIVAIGMGADDAFIFCKVWNVNKQDKERSFLKIMTDTVYHAYFSMFVTSLTTAGAFLASYISTITAIRCFSIFASIAVMANCLLMMSWFPACVVVREVFCTSRFEKVKCCIWSCLDKWCCLPAMKIFLGKVKLMYANLDNLWTIKERAILESVIKLKYVWLTVLTILAIISSIIVFYYPKLQLPTSPEFQLFHSSHLFEQYDLVYKQHFWFKRSEKIHGGNGNAKMPLRFVWGVLPVDNGDYLDPQSYGDLELDETFDMSAPESQLWLLQFCRNIRKQPFYQSTLGPLLPNCFIESFESWMQRKCVDPVYKVNRGPCCETETFPFNSSVFNACIIEAIHELYTTPSEYLIPGVAGPKFSKYDDFPTVKAVVVEYDSKYTYSMSYDYMDEFITQVEEFMAKQLETAPATMKGGWFISDVQFYDLQKVLSNGSLAAIGVSMAFALIILLLSTLNVLTSLYAIVTITCSILVTIAILVLLGWKLNILESIAISTAIGLTVDFSLHYTVNYRFCVSRMCDDRKAAVRFALGNMMGPSLMAAITTGIAGAFMLPSLILPYIQIGILLVTVMSTSWLYATFYLGAILAWIGPQNQFGQFEYSTIFGCKKKKNNNKNTENETQAPFNILDAHELESLTNKDTLRPSSRSLQRSFSGGRIIPNNRNPLSDQSPSATSAITIIVAEDN